MHHLFQFQHKTDYPDELFLIRDRFYTHWYKRSLLIFPIPALCLYLKAIVRQSLNILFSYSNTFSCLNDVPPGLDTSESVSVINLAKNFSGDDQCRLMYGENYNHCGAFKVCVCLHGRIYWWLGGGGGGVKPHLESL